MTYQLEIKDGLFNLYSPKIGMNVLENVTFDEVRVAIATEMEYTVKLEIVEFLMTFPHGYEGTDNTIFVREDAVKEFEEWRHKTHQRIGFPDEYHALIDQKIYDCFSVEK